MLTADLVQASRRGDTLAIRKLDREAEARARRFAEAYLSAAEQHLCKTKADFDAACKAVSVHVRDKKLAGGLLKMVQDRCTFEPTGEVDAVALRQAVFRQAAAQRAAADRTESFDRLHVLETAGAPFGLSAEAADAALFADLKSAHVMTGFEATTPDRLVAGYHRAQEQAVLLRAVRVTVEIRAASAPLFRTLFHRLKFLRLLYVVHPLPNGAHRIEIDGPFSLFTAVTKYGLQLALLLPILDEVGRWRLEAAVKWGKDKMPMRFRLKGPQGNNFQEWPDDTRPPGESAHLLSEDVQALIERFRALDTHWDVAPAVDVLELPGQGLTIPDLIFVHKETGEAVYLEVMGFWSRDAVWNRVELVQAGLAEQIIFAASSRLRVSEAALDADLPGTLYVYKGVMNAAKIARILDEKISRSELDIKGQDK